MTKEFVKANHTGDVTARLMRKLSVMDRLTDAIYKDLTEDIDQNDVKTQDKVFDAVFNSYGEFISNVRNEIVQYVSRRLSTTD